jgi:hypothetical protein
LFHRQKQRFEFGPVTRESLNWLYLDLDIVALEEIGVLLIPANRSAISYNSDAMGVSQHR